ncbi:putative E3 ubiquitin-protein ligase makorin-1 [Trichinella zimbabwensis]|uniref:RING-type E3 ubiquitin transferase n=1 Tax=Trichinella zimbabwensis TaxID=268475 RepID=A0A0V1GU82_9BILA|nr:putative E3 ubiquitin-protein ligase makorin-1 [Trichinella zimbabwensis]
MNYVNKVAFLNSCGGELFVMSNRQAGRDMEKVLCRFYKNGNCRKGIKCAFSHNLAEAKSVVCHNFLTGSCTYGSSCRYDHIPQTWVFRNLEQVGFPMVNEASKSEPEAAASHVNLNDRTQISASTAQSHNDVVGNVETVVENGAREDILCGYNVLGNCPFGENCKYVHGDMCELCKRRIIRPGNDAYKLRHQEKCMKEQNFELELQRLIAASNEKQCGICLETVMKNKENCRQTFGILPNCEHCFCIKCIRKWRQADKSLQNSQACPLCRIVSRFVVPSPVWVNTPQELAHVFDSYLTL